MTVFFTSDTHFLHKKVSEMRGFHSPAIHDEAVIGIWNRVVRPDDIVWLLGDVGIPSKGFTDADVLTLVARLNGRKHLITGNHDSPWPAHRNSKNNQRAWLNVFESVQAFAMQSVCGTDFLMSHFPYVGDTTGHDEDRAAQFRLRDHGFPLLHGHVHSKEKITRAGDNFVGPVVHVGWDAWGKPVKDTEIKELLNA